MECRARWCGGIGVIFRGDVGSVPGDKPAEPTLHRFAFAVSDKGSQKLRDKNRREVAEYVVGWLGSARIVDEWEDGWKRWLSVRVATPISRAMAKRFALACPRYVRGSFAPDRDI